MASTSTNATPSTSSATKIHRRPTDEGKLLQQMLDCCRAFIAKRLTQAETIMQLRMLLESSPIAAPSLLFDILVALQSEFDEERAKKERADDIVAFLEQVEKELLPSEVLSLELNALGADTAATKSKLVKSKTRIYYKQLKFNLLREESEGYAKLITELMHPSTPDNELILTIDCLIGQFNLDPNRVIDIILECFEQSEPELQNQDVLLEEQSETRPQNRALYLRLIRDFKVDKADLLCILALKFVFCQRAEETPMSLYNLASILAQEQLVDILDLFNLVDPTQRKIMAESKELAELIRQRSVRAETISSSGASILASTNESLPISSILNARDDSPEPSGTTPAVSFSAAIQCQINEDQKLAKDRFDDTILNKNQKLGLLCALLEHGTLELAKPLLDRLPDVYPFGICRRIPQALANIIGYKIEPFYRRKYSHYGESMEDMKMKEAWSFFTQKPEQVDDWPALFNDACQLAFQLGPYIGARHEVAIKLIRLLNIFNEDPEAENLAEFDDYQNMIVDLCDSVLVPAASLLDSNFSYCEELWQVLGRLPYQQRYCIYHRWRTVHTDRWWDLCLQKGKVLGMTRYIMKRLSKDTAKIMGRQLGKLCHAYPTIPLDYLLSKVQEFQNFIGPVVESIRFLSSLEFDVLAYCLIENLAAPDKQDFKISDISYSPWLQSLASFAAAIFKRYSIDFGGILQYIANQLKDAKNMDLIVLREIVTGISGVESLTDLTQEHLEALCGGDLLRSEASYLQMNKLNRRSINRLRDALLRDSLFESLCILIGQQKQFIIFRDYKDFPLKLTTQMLDQCQETFVQFFHFLRTNLKPEQYARRMPSTLALLTEYHLPVEAAFGLTRPIYMNDIEVAYNAAKQKKRDELKASKLDSPTKSALYKEVFMKKLDALGDELKKAFPDAFWTDITFRLHTLFWMLSVNDLSVPENAYERGVEKCKKELQDLQQSNAENSTSGRGGAQKRTAKDEERLKELEKLEKKLVDEKRKQMEHKSRILDILADEQIKKTFFASQNKASQMWRFFQCCALPRLICSEVDAVYVAKFVESLHSLKTDDFQTVVFFDKLFTDITPILAGFSEREAMCFGRFCSMVLELILRWHAKEESYKKECEGFPGCDTKIRKKDTDEKAADSFRYDLFRSICYKWQCRLTKSFGYMLTQKEKNYVLIRNALTMMLKILPNFPVLIIMNNTLEDNVKMVRDQEKGNRHDLNLLASSYLVQLKKRNDLWQTPGHFEKTGRKLWPNAEFSDIGNKTAKTSGAKVSPSKKPQITGPENSSGKSSTSAASPIPPSSKSSGHTGSSPPPKRSRQAPVRSSKN